MFPGGLVLRIPGFHCYDPGSIPAQGSEIPKAVQQDQKQKKIPQTKNIFWFYSLYQLLWLLDGEDICPKFEAIYDRFNRRISHLSVERIFCLLAYEFKHKNSVFV